MHFAQQDFEQSFDHVDNSEALDICVSRLYMSKQMIYCILMHFTFTFTFSHLADAFIQSDLQLEHFAIVLQT